MSNLVSIDYLLQLFTLIYIIPVSITIENSIKFSFLNGLNVVRCSDDQLQVYRLGSDSNKVISELVTCNNKDEIYSNQYVGFKWSELRVICSKDNTQVHVEQYIEVKLYGTELADMPTAASQLDQSTEFYNLQIEYDDDTHIIKLITSGQAANEAYFSEHDEIKEKTIYIWFPDHPILCRLKFTSDEENPCPSMADQNVDNVKYACYYNPGTEETVTVTEMEAELKQVEQAGALSDEEAFVLDLSKPDIVPDETSTPQSTNQSKKSSTKKRLPFKTTSNSSRLNNESNTSKSILIILGIILLIGPIGGIIYYLLNKHGLINSSSSLTVEDNNKDTPSLAPNLSQQSLAVTATDDPRIIESMHVPANEETPYVELQSSDKSQKVRGGITMMFNEDT